MKFQIMKKTDKDGEWYLILKDGISVAAAFDEKDAYEKFDKAILTYKPKTEIIKEVEI